jgi:hypothetical protein
MADDEPMPPAPAPAAWPKHGGARQYGNPDENFKNRMARGQHSKMISGSNLGNGGKVHPAKGGE